jgi:hypothetical protein
MVDDPFLLLVLVQERERGKERGKGKGRAAIGMQAGDNRERLAGPWSARCMTGGLLHRLAAGVGRGLGAGERIDDSGISVGPAEDQ